jgi:hypothetical protein
MILLSVVLKIIQRDAFNFFIIIIKIDIIIKKLI